MLVSLLGLGRSLVLLLRPLVLGLGIWLGRRSTEFCGLLSLVIAEVSDSLAVDCMVLKKTDIVDFGVAHSIEVVEFGTAGFEVVHTVDSEAVDKSTVHTAAETKHPAQPTHALSFSALLFSADAPQIAAVSPSPTAFPSYTPPSPCRQNP